MKKILFTLVLMLFVGTVAFGQVYVKFQVNMGAAIYNGQFIPATGTLEARGDYQHVAGESDWSTSTHLLTPQTTGDSIYTVTITLDDSAKGKTFNFKYVANGGYEGIANNRTFTAPATTGQTFTTPVVYFNDDSSHIGPQIHNKIKFVADLSGIYGSGQGFFDPTRDSIQVNGLDWSAPNYVSGNKILHQNGFTPTQYETDTIVVGGYVGDSTSWKFKAFPDLDFVNSGWENLSDPPFSGTNRWYHFVSDTTNLITLPTIVPAITPSQPPITRDVTLTFKMDMSGTIKDAHNNYTIPYDSIQFVGLRSGLVGLGDWTSGNWNPSDTANHEQHMRVLQDNGLDGDATAGDKIWSDTVVIPSGTPGGHVDYKYGVYYGTACDTANGGTSIMDNEAAFGVNNNFTLTNNDMTITNVWGVITAIEKENGVATPLSYRLSQNYPNPFNPSTVIQYNLPKSGIVTLKIFDILGREVATLVNEQQVAGAYKVTFDASRLASGIYFYRIMSGNFISTKKMVLLK